MLSLIIAVTIVCAILLGAHVAVYKSWRRIFAVSNLALWSGTRVLMFILAGGFVGSFWVISRYNNLFTRLWYLVCASWLGFLLYFFLAALVYYAFLLLVRISGLPKEPWLSRAGKLLMAAAIIISFYGLYHAQDIKIKTVSLTLPGLPDSWRGRRAVFYADAHLGQIYGEGFSRRIADHVRTLDPDIVFDAGDLYDGVAVSEREVIRPLAELEPPLGHYFVMGNHEEYGDSAAYAAAIREAGITILDNEKAVVDGLQIIGVDYESARTAVDLENVLHRIGVATDSPSILIKHVPADLDTAVSADIDLQISGHTHRAQVFPFGYITKAVYKGYDYGLKSFGTMRVLVTSGVGSWGPPLRVGSQSEIIVIDFR